jgi:lysophospholipase L1-like esterase
MVLAAVGCGADDSAAPGGGGASSGGSGGASGGSAGTGGAAGVGTGGGAGGGVGGAAGGGAGTGGVAGSGTGGTGATGGAQGLADVGSLVVLGDSISDGGGQPPFYYDLLKADLQAKFGAINYKNNAQSGSKTGALEGQVKGLPGVLPGPVAVAITSGGNDMKDQLPAILTGTDGPARAQMGANISKALSLLLAPGRFGAGVDVHVYEANIYDASDGQGNFGSNGCAFGKGLPAVATDGFFASWNGEIQSQVGAKGQLLMDIHGAFGMHGFNHPPSWYASDCTHPNSTGHDKLRRYFYQQITGETLP